MDYIDGVNLNNSDEYDIKPNKVQATSGTIGDNTDILTTPDGIQYIKASALENYIENKINARFAQKEGGVYQSVSGALTELDIMAENFNLFVNATISQAEVTRTTYSERKFSDYDLIIFTLGTTPYNRLATSILHKSMITNNMELRLSTIYGDGNLVSNIKLLSDTTFNTQFTDNSTAHIQTVYINIQGVKLHKRI